VAKVLSPAKICLWLVVSIHIRRRSIGNSAFRINRSGLLLFEQLIQFQQIAAFNCLQRAKFSFLQSNRQFFGHGRCLRRRCGVGSIRNSENLPESLVECGKILGLSSPKRVRQKNPGTAAPSSAAASPAKFRKFLFRLCR